MGQTCFLPRCNCFGVYSKFHSCLSETNLRTARLAIDFVLGGKSRHHRKRAEESIASDHLTSHTYLIFLPLLCFSILLSYRTHFKTRPLILPVSPGLKLKAEGLQLPTMTGVLREGQESSSTLTHSNQELSPQSPNEPPNEASMSGRKVNGAGRAEKEEKDQNLEVGSGTEVEEEERILMKGKENYSKLTWKQLTVGK